MNSANPCIELKKLVAELPSLPSAWEELVSKGINSHYRQKFIGVVRQREAFLKDYQAQVEKLLMDCFKGVDVSGKVEIASDGRVVVNGGLKLEGRDIDYFPSIIKRVSGELNIQRTKLQNLDHLEEAGTIKAAGLETLQSMNSLTSVEEHLFIAETNIRSLPSLQMVGGLSASEAENLESLPRLRIVKNSLSIWGTKIKTLPELTMVGSRLSAKGLVTLTSLPKLQKVGNLQIKGTNIRQLPELRIAETLYASHVVSLSAIPRLQKAGSLNIEGTSVRELPSLVEVDDLFAEGLITLQKLPKLQNVFGVCLLSETSIKSLPSLKFVKFDLDVHNAELLTSIPCLENVKSQLNIGGTALKSLSSLQTVGGAIILSAENSNILNKLKIDDINRLFPVLEEIGKDFHGVSVYTDEERIRNQFIKAKGIGKLSYPGTIEVGKIWTD
jgi:hypothetical protein